MDVLEKIFEEIEDHAIEFESFGMCDDYVSVGWVKEVIRSHMDEAKDANAPSNDGWIQVEDELPKETEKEYYPVMYVTTSYGVVAWGFYRVKDEQWYLYNDIMEEFESVENNKIIAWQPLPEPYKPKKNIPVEGMDHIMRRFTKVE